MLLGNVVDQLLDNYGLADAGTAEDADLTALTERCDEIDNLDTGLKDLRCRLLFNQRGGRPMNRITSLGVHGARIVDGLAEHIENAPQCSFADRHGNGRAEVNRLGATPKALSGPHGH